MVTAMKFLSHSRKNTPFRRGSITVSTVLRKSVRFFIINIFLVKNLKLSKLISGKWSIIPDNYSLAQNRLVSLLKRLKSSESKLLNQYDNVIKEQLDSGVVEVIDKHEEEVVPGTVHYIPHKEVLKEDRATTKVRVVYDASAKSYSEPSLNDCLLSGPALTPLLFDILLRFRLPKIALIGDLEKAFLNSIHSECDITKPLIKV